MIFVEPLGGLANRMRVIASSVKLGAMVNKKVVVIWNENYEINCPFDLLFENSQLFQVQPKNLLYRFLESTNQPGIKKIKTVIKNKLIGIDYCITEADFPELIWSGKLDLSKVAKYNRNIYIQTCQEFGDNLSYECLKPVKELEGRIDSVSSLFDEFTLGIHIRRTDNETSIVNSPIELFVNTMKAEIEIDSRTNFFMCSDDLEVINHVKNLFGEKIITFERELTRETRKGIMDAVVDIFCLAKTSKIYGSYWSSFSEVAAQLGNTKMITVKIN